MTERVVIVGGGMAAVRLAEQLVGADVSLTVLADEPTRPTTASCSRPSSRGPTPPTRSSSARPRGSRRAGSTCASARGWSRSTARRVRSCWWTGNGWASIGSSWRPERSPPSRRSAAWSVATAPCTRRSTRSGASRTVVGSTRPSRRWSRKAQQLCNETQSRRHRGRPARPPGRAGPVGPRRPHRGCRGRGPPARQPGGPCRGLRARPRPAPPRHRRLHRGARRPDDRRTASSSTTAPSCRPTSSCSPREAVRPPHSLAVPG